MKRRFRLVLCSALLAYGCGGGGIPQVSLSSTTMELGSAAVGTTSEPTQLTVTNSGTGTLHIAKVSTTGDFEATDLCSNSVIAKAACAIEVTFAPSATGVSSGTLSISDDAPGSPHTVDLSGKGLDVGTSCSAKGQQCLQHSCCQGTCNAEGNRRYCR